MPVWEIDTSPPELRYRDRFSNSVNGLANLAAAIMQRRQRQAKNAERAEDRKQDRRYKALRIQKLENELDAPKTADSKPLSGTVLRHLKYTTKEVPVYDDYDGKPVMDEDGNPVTETKLVPLPPEQVRANLMQVGRHPLNLLPLGPDNPYQIPTPTLEEQVAEPVEGRTRPGSQPRQPSPETQRPDTAGVAGSLLRAIGPERAGMPLQTQPAAMQTAPGLRAALETQARPDAGPSIDDTMQRALAGDARSPLEAAWGMDAGAVRPQPVIRPDTGSHAAEEGRRRGQGENADFVRGVRDQAEALKAEMREGLGQLSEEQRALVRPLVRQALRDGSYREVLDTAIAGRDLKPGPYRWLVQTAAPALSQIAEADSRAAARLALVRRLQAGKLREARSLLEELQKGDDYVAPGQTPEADRFFAGAARYNQGR